MAIAILYMLPLNLNIGDFGDKPIDLAVSNVLLIALPTLFLKRRSVSQLTFFGLIMPLFFLVIGLSSAIIRGGDMSIVLSALSFSIPILHVGVGYIVGQSRLNFSFLNVSYALSIIILVLVFSDLIFGNFPRGCGYQGRWGGCFGGLEVYGFPNAPMNFLAICSPILALPFIRKCGQTWRIFALLAIVGLIVMTPLSLSRSASLVFLFSGGAMIIMLFGKMALFAYAALCLVVVLSFQWIISLTMFAGIAFRIQASVEAGDLTTGRIGIWKDALFIWAENPLFGKAFIPFSEFSSFGTVHQQYLEVLFKSGLIGATAYFGYIFVTARLAYQTICKGDHYSVNDRRVFIAFGACLFIGNLFQNAISYQPMGNFLFFAMGIFSARSFSKLQVTYETNPPEPFHRGLRTD